MSSHLESLCADIRSQGIVLNDDISRLSASASDSLLSTVMGNGASAGRPEDLENFIRGEADLADHLSAAGDHEQDLVDAIKGMIVNRCIQSSLATQRHCCTLVTDQYNAKLIDNIAKLEATTIGLLRDCKGIVSAAEARANITVTTTRRNNQTTFEESMKVIGDKIEVLAKLDTRLVGVSTAITAAYSDTAKSATEVDNEVESLNRVQKGVETQKTIIVRNMVKHFSECQGILRDTNTKDNVELKIPENLDRGKGKLLMENVLAYLGCRIDMYYAILPQLIRLCNDYDSNSGHFYKPPSISSELTTTNLISAHTKTKYLAQSKKLYAELLRKLNRTTAARLKTTFNFGTDDANTATCDVDDGPNAVFALICMFTPQGEDHCHQLEQTFYSSVETLTDGRTDPRKTIAKLKDSIVQAVEMQLELKWSLTGKLIYEAMSHDDHNMSKALSKFQKIKPSDAQTIAKLDEMFAAILSQCTKDVKYADTGNRDKRGLFANGRLGAGNKRKRETSKDTDKADEECRFGRECSRRNCERQHPKGRKIDRNNDRNSDRNSDRNPDRPDPKSKVPCKAKGCTETFLRGHHRRILCSDCYNQAIGNKGLITLKDGTSKQFDVSLKNLNNRQADNVHKLVRKAYQAGSKRPPSDDASDDDFDGDTRAAPLKVRTKRAKAATQAIDKELHSDAAFQKFANNIGLHLNVGDDSN